MRVFLPSFISAKATTSPKCVSPLLESQQQALWSGPGEKGPRGLRSIQGPWQAPGSAG